MDKPSRNACFNLTRTQMLLSKEKKHRVVGFSLIELLVVLSIMGLTMSFVAPNVFSLKTRFDIQAEKKHLRLYIQEQSYKSYFHESPQVINFVGNQVISELSAPLTFEYLAFPQQSLTVTKYGKFDDFTLAYAQSEQWLELTIVAP